MEALAPLEGHGRDGDEAEKHRPEERPELIDPFWKDKWITRAHRAGDDSEVRPWTQDRMRGSSGTRIGPDQGVDSRAQLLRIGGAFPERALQVAGVE